MIPGQEVTIDRTRPWVRARCPCGGEFIAGETTRSDPHMFEFVCLHTMPPCTQYVVLPVKEFMRDARERGAVTIDDGGWVS